jgi:hypothetical protein
MPRSQAAFDCTTIPYEEQRAETIGFVTDAMVMQRIQPNRQRWYDDPFCMRSACCHHSQATCRYNSTAFTACRGPWRGGPWRRPCRQPSSPLLLMQPAWPAVGATESRMLSLLPKSYYTQLRPVLRALPHCWPASRCDRQLTSRCACWITCFAFLARSLISRSAASRDAWRCSGFSARFFWMTCCAVSTRSQGCLQQTL